MLQQENWGLRNAKKNREKSSVPFLAVYAALPMGYGKSPFYRYSLRFCAVDIQSLYTSTISLHFALLLKLY